MLAFGVVLLQEGIPVLFVVLVEVTDDLFDRSLLLVVAFCAAGDEGVGDDLLQRLAVFAALGLLQEALDVVFDQTAVGEDGVDVDVVVLGGVLVGGEDCDEEERANDCELHVVGCDW